MANRLANLSKPGRFDTFDTDLCACVCVCILRALPVSHYRKDAVKGPWQFKQVAHYNARSVSFALPHVMTGSFSAAGQNKHCPRTESWKISPPPRWSTDDPLPSTVEPKQPPDSATVLWFLIKIIAEASATNEAYFSCKWLCFRETPDLFCIWIGSYPNVLLSAR